MSQEEKQKLEAALEKAKLAADQALAAANTAGDTDEALNKKAADAEAEVERLQAELDAAVVDDAPAPATGEEGEDVDEEENIDFDKELENLEGGGKPPAQPAQKSELEKAQKALFFNAKRVKELGGDPATILGEAEPVAPVVVPPVVAAAPADDPRYASKEDLAEIEAGKLAQTDAERKVIMHHYRNSIKLTGNIVTDVQNAYMLAHKGRIQRSFSEIRRGSFARPNAAPTAPGRRPAAKPTQAPKLSAQDHATLIRRGYKQLADGSYESKRYIVRYDATLKRMVTVAKPR